METCVLRFKLENCLHEQYYSAVFNQPVLPAEDSPTKDIDCLLLNIHCHLMIKNKLWATHSTCVFCDQCPLPRFDVIHIKITL